MKILSIIVSYNFMPWIDRCLPSLMQSTQPTDILVIDNSSSDETISYIRKYYPQVKLIANTSNLGFGAANNIGMQMAIDEGYDGVFLINQDAWLEPDALQQLVEVSLHHPEYGIISPLHLTGDGSKLDRAFASFIGWTSMQKYDEESVNTKGIVKPPNFINAAFWYIPTFVIRKVGLFSPLFFIYGEDNDYENRVHYHGYQAVCVRTAIGYHDREHRPYNINSYIRTQEMYHLSQYANINYSFAKAFYYGVLVPVRKAKAIYSADKCNWHVSIDYLGMSIRLLMRTITVLKTRKQVKSPKYLLNRTSPVYGT